MQQLREAAEAEARAAEIAAPESELDVTAAVREAKVRIKPACGYAVKEDAGDDPVAIEVQCTFAGSAEVTVDASVVDTEATEPVWNGEIALEPLPLRFAVLGRAPAVSS